MSHRSESADAIKASLEFYAEKYSDRHMAGLLYATEALSNEAKITELADHHERWKGLFAWELISYILWTQYEEAQGRNPKDHKCQRYAALLAKLGPNSLYLDVDPDLAGQISRTHPLGSPNLLDRKLAADFLAKYHHP